MRLSAQGLKSRDTFGKSDPMAVLLEKVGNGWTECGRTEVKTNDHSTALPTWLSEFECRLAIGFATIFKLHCAQLLCPGEGAIPAPM